MATSIKELMGSAYAAGFDVQTRTTIDGRMTVPEYNDLTTQSYWESKDGGYWIYNGLVTSVKTGTNAGEIYVLVGVDETLTATTWQSPKKPGDDGYDSYTGPKWMSIGTTDSYLRKAEYVLAKYGYKKDVATPGYYEQPARTVWDTKEHADAESTNPEHQVSYSQYIKLTVAASEDLTSPTKIIYCDVSQIVTKTNLVGNGCIKVSDPDPTTQVCTVGLYWEEPEN